MPEPQIALKVAYLGPVLNANPYFETNASNWTVAGGTVARSTVQKHEGNASLLLTPDGVTVTATARSEMVTVTAGVTYRASEWVRCAVARSVGAAINWYDASSVFISSSTASVSVAANTWTLLDFTATAPVGAAKGQITAFMTGTPPGSNLLHIDEAILLPDWTDLAGRLLYGDGGGPLTIDIGRQTELQDVEPTRISCVLKNGDGALNPRNPASPYYGTWEQGRQVRITETVDGEQIDLATGYLEIPDVQVNSPNLDQPCSISAVDRLGRLSGAPPFAGTLAEHVRTQGGNLALHYPLDDAYPHMSSNTLSTLARVVVGFDTSVVAEPEDLIEAANLAGPPGDDQSYARWAPVSDGAGFLARARLEASVTVKVGATDTLAVSVWVHSQPDGNGYAYSGGFFDLIDSAGAPGVLLSDSGTDGSLRFNWRNAAFGDSPVLLGRRMERDAWRLITMRINAATGAMDFWEGADLVASGTAGTPPGAVTLTLIRLGLLYVGGMAHVQVRVGPDATTMTRAMHLAQYAHGYLGLHRQTVADRIATLAGYAGVPASELELPAEASTPMQRAKLGGSNPTAAMQGTATAGQDTLMTTPQGRITLVPRGRRYNQPVTLQIPFGWLSRGGIRYRPDKPVTDTVGAREGGGTARRVDETARARYGVLARTVTLDSDVEGDAANWASWTLAAFGQPRTRCPLLRINLLDRALADRKALLRLKVGDRIQLTGMPANSPEDVPHLIVQGIRHIIGPHRKRLIELNTSPLLGPTPGNPPACPVVGDLVSATAIVAY